MLSNPTWHWNMVWLYWKPPPMIILFPSLEVNIVNEFLHHVIEMRQNDCDKLSCVWFVLFEYFQIYTLCKSAWAIDKTRSRYSFYYMPLLFKFPSTTMLPLSGQSILDGHKGFLSKSKRTVDAYLESWMLLVDI